MKGILFGCAMVGLLRPVYAQDRLEILNSGPRSGHESIARTDTNVAPVGSSGSGRQVTSITNPPGTVIGFSTYDYGSNGSSLRNLVLQDDGTISFVRMLALELDPSNPDRGSYFSCSSDGGSVWSPLAKVELDRVGWSNIDGFQGRTVVAAHLFTTQFEANLGAVHCPASWTTLGPGFVSDWPRMAVGTSGSIHVLGVVGPYPGEVVYSRFTSVHGWDRVKVSLVSQPIASSDYYDIATHGRRVAFAVAGPPGTSEQSLSGSSDVILLESSDNGDTWSETVIYDVAGDGELPAGETELQPDGSVALTFDRTGRIHVLWGTYLATGNANNNPVTDYSQDAGIMYWNAESGTQVIALPSQDPGIGHPVGRYGDYATQPDIGVDHSGNLYVVYVSVISERDPRGKPYQHIFGLRSTDSGVTWNSPADLTPGSGFDASWPSLADSVDDKLHIVYFADSLAGNWVFGDHNQFPVAVRYLEVEAAMLGTQIPCEDITNLQGRCIRGSPYSLQFRVNLLNSTVHAGKTVHFDVDGTDYPAVIVTSGVHSRASVQVTGVAAGTYTISLTDPPGCLDPLIVGCGSYSSLDPEWEAMDAVWTESAPRGMTPQTTTLLDNYPNPFNSISNFEFRISNLSQVSLKIYNLLGEEVATLVSGQMDAGNHAVSWDATGEPSGVYFYRLEAGGHVETRKLVLLR